MADGGLGMIATRMSQVTGDRIAVVVGAGTLGVTLNLGEVQVSARAPPPARWAEMSSETLRTAALRAAVSVGPSSQRPGVHLSGPASQAAGLILALIHKR